MKATGRLLDLIEQYRPHFLARTRREKVLFSAFLVVIALVWAGTMPARLGEGSRDLRLARGSIAEQDRWLDGRERIEADYQRALESLNPEMFPPRQQAVAQLEGHARQAGLAPKIDPSTSTKSDRLIFHTINVSFDRVTFAKVAEYQRAVAAALPSVNLKTIVLSSRPGVAGAAEITARLTYEAIEYTN
jgi:hypothetical protein